MQFNSTRQGMAWLHTWLGLILGFVLMVCFFFGALSVFDREIDRWAIPETRFDPQPMPSFDNLLMGVFERIEPDEAEYQRMMPEYHDASAGEMTPRLELPADEYWAYTTHRDPVLRMGAGFRVPFPANPEGHNHIHGNTTIDPRTGLSVPDHHLKIGSEWFYPLHYSLNLNWNRIGFFIVGIAGFFMLVALISGVWIHRKIFRELFTFRRHKSKQRSILDMHNMTGVVALPFHFFFAFTGLIIFVAFYYMPVTNTMLEPLHSAQQAIEAEEMGLPHERAGIPAPMASVDAMVAEAKRRWAARDMAGEVGFLQMHHVGDQNAYVSIYRAGSDRVALVGEGIHFNGVTGDVLREDPPHSLAESIGDFLAGLHLQHFEHWFLRWLYVIGGLLGCACIATGFMFFVEKRKQQHAKAGSQGSRIVDAFAVTTVTGMVIAAIVMLIANRIIPSATEGKGDIEKLVFWSVWALSFLHAIWRSAAVALAKTNPAWREQTVLIALLGVVAVIANWISTGDHLIKTIFTDPYWAVAGVDLSLLAGSLIALLAVKKMTATHETERKQETSQEKLATGEAAYE